MNKEEQEIEKKRKEGYVLPCLLKKIGETQGIVSAAESSVPLTGEREDKTAQTQALLGMFSCALYLLSTEHHHHHYHHHRHYH